MARFNEVNSFITIHSDAHLINFVEYLSNFLDLLNRHFKTFESVTWLTNDKLFREKLSKI